MNLLPVRMLRSEQRIKSACFLLSASIMLLNTIDLSPVLRSIFRQLAQKSLESHNVFFGQLSLQSLSQCTSHSPLPTGSLVVDISTSPGNFPRRIDLDARWGSYNPGQ
jgi:hypothetical protein